ncbi:MAG: polynucleotide kinase-phosphatase [Patulibacter minatonensis]
MTSTIELPSPSLVLLVGTTGSGKSTFARKHFLPTEVVSSDAARGLIADDENDQTATKAAFEVVQFLAGKRLEQPRLTVIDATNVKRDARKPLLELARRHDLFAVAIVLDLPEEECQRRNRERPDRDFGPHVIRNQASHLKRSIKGLQREGFQRVWVLRGADEIDGVTIERRPLWTDRRAEHGPFDVIGDVHGCHAELTELLSKLDYRVAEDGLQAVPPAGRRAVFVGDLVDRGPASPGVLRLVINMVAEGHAIAVPGNHDDKLVRKLSGRNVQLRHGIAETLEQLDREPPEFKDEVREFLRGLVSHVVLDDGKLVVAHAGLKESYHGRSSGRVRSFALYGDTTGETDELGLPVRLPWADDYRGQAAVVYGHTPVGDPVWVNNTLNIDTGCVFGGRLTALRWPERELVTVPAHERYTEPPRPLLDPRAAAAGDDRPGSVLDLRDVTGKRLLHTRLLPSINIGEEQSAAALEVMSRFAIDPRWLVYLPPTMAPPATSDRPDVLEHPDEVFAELRRAGVERVVCEEKHMGSRAIAVVCRDAEVAERRFGIATGETGALYTRTGRAFLGTRAETEAALTHIRGAAERSGVFDDLQTDWLVLDAELMPWSAKAMSLVRTQYASVGAAGTAGLAAAADVLAAATARAVDVGELAAHVARRQEHVARYVESYDRYVAPADGVDDLRFAPFHVLAAEGAAFVDRDHGWHLELADRLVAADPEWIVRTERRIVALEDEAATADAVAWWESLTAAGGEGMVVKPWTFVQEGRKGIVQPGIKCRGPEYLRIIYGPEYRDATQIDRLRKRNLGRKRGLAGREFALGVEALERFVAQEPLYRVHECVFAVLALESEALDPRL